MNVSVGGLAAPASQLLSRLMNPGARPNSDDLTAAVAGRTVLVTGASHGIGRATAAKLAGAGATVLTAARSGDLLAEQAQQLGGNVHPFALDLADQDAIAAALPRLLEVTGHVDVVVSNAGKSIRRSVADTAGRFHDITRTNAVNYLGPVQLLLGLLPGMRERGDGHVVNVSTIGAVVPPLPFWGAYQASKSAFDVWLRSAAAETKADGVTATSVYLALVHTRMSAPTSWRVPGLSPEQAADVICHAIVKRPSAINPWWAAALDTFDGAVRGPSDHLVRRYGASLEQRV